MRLRTRKPNPPAPFANSTVDLAFPAREGGEGQLRSSPPSIIGKTAGGLGLRQVLRIHAALYIGSIVIDLIAIALFTFTQFPPIWKAALALVSIALFYFCAMSLLVADWVYDRSDARRGKWLNELLPSEPERWVNIHHGMDDFSAMLNRRLPGRCGGIFDIFDPVEMTERSIARGRALFPARLPHARASFDALPLAGASCDLVLLGFVAHELRRPAARRAFFAELHRVLRPGGCVAILEHFRSAPLWLAFGPKAPHFYRLETWLKLARETVFDVVARKSMTPFAGVLILKKPE
jgi:SAM-dependent methyltransferase